MAQKEFTMQVRVITDNPAQFETIKKMLSKVAAEVYAAALIMAGSSAQKPDIKLFSEDFIDGKEEILGGDVMPSVQKHTLDNADDEDRVL